MPLAKKIFDLRASLKPLVQDNGNLNILMPVHYLGKYFMTLPQFLLQI